MIDQLATRVGELVDLGWNLKSQTETTAWLETRRPINWLLFFFFLLFFFILGALIYLIIWSLADKVRIFVAANKDGVLSQHGNSWLLELQEREREKSIKKAQEIKQRGYWAVMWPSFVGMLVIIALWFWLFWALFF